MPVESAITSIFQIPINMAFLASDFQSIDAADDAGHLLSCLDAIWNQPFFHAVKEESYRLLQVRPGCRVLEIGCGTGDDARALARHAGAGSLVVATDISRKLITRAKRGAPESSAAEDEHLDPNFLLMDGRALAVRDGSMDAVREDRALQHIRRPECVIAEAERVLKPGGVFVAFEPDWGTFIVDAKDRGTTRTILHYWSDGFMNGWIGRELAGLCKDAGFTDVRILPRTLIVHDLATCDRIFALRDTVCRAADDGYITQANAAAWIGGVEESDRTGRFLCSLTMFLVSCKKNSDR